MIILSDFILYDAGRLSSCPAVYPVLSAECLSVEDFPEHIKKLVQKEKESEEQEKRQREIERNTCKVRCSQAWLVLPLNNYQPV